MRQVELTANGWLAEGLLATSFSDRLMGRFSLPRDSVVVIPTRSVHSFGQEGAMEVFALDAQMRVIETRTMIPNQIAWFRSAKIVVELPASSPVPSPGDRVIIRDV
jgi:hypothetical protein